MHTHRPHTTRLATILTPVPFAAGADPPAIVLVVTTAATAVVTAVSRSLPLRSLPLAMGIVFTAAGLIAGAGSLLL